MKLCPACSSAFDSNGWLCPYCGNAPAVTDGITLLTAEPASQSAGYDPIWFDRLAAVEDENWWFRSRNRLILRALRRSFPEARSVLELGCGTGYVLQALARDGYDVTGTELLLSGMRYARRRAPGAGFIQLDARALPFSAEFDVVAAFDVLEHIAEDQDVLREMARAVRPGGGVMLTVPQHPWLWSKADEHAHHQRRYTRRELTRKLRNARLEPRSVTSFVTLALPLMVVARALERHSETYDPMAEFSIPHWVNSLLEQTCGFERLLIGSGISLPMGGSLLVAARRI